MKISPEIIEKFRRAYFEEFGEVIFPKETYGIFSNLVDLLRAIIFPEKKSSKNIEL